MIATTFYSTTKQYSSFKKNLLLTIAQFCFLLIASFSTFAQKTIRIDTKDNLLLLGVDTNASLKQLYFGKSINDIDALSTSFEKNADAYSSYGNDVEHTALRVTHSDGNLTTDLVFVSSNTTKQDSNISITKIILKDKFYPDEVTLFYKTYSEQNIIEEWMTFSHKEKSPVTLYDFASSSLNFQTPNAYLDYFYGDWANEFNLVETKLSEGGKTIDSKLGVRTDQRSNQSFLLSLNGKLQEDDGEVIAGTLAWPGNWQLQFNEDHYNNLQVTAGMNPFASEYILKADTTFTTPGFLFTYSDKGAGETTRNFHRWARKYGIDDGYGERDVLLNNWEATYFDFDEQKLTSIIKDAGRMGFELFLLDDGWFANKYPRNNDDAGLGDWDVNTKKLPHGLSYLADVCKQNNLKFGIWVEPEMVNPKSELYEKHPDWIITAQHRDLNLSRNQLILDITNPKVQDYVYNVLDKTMSENKGISYIKWDCNRYITNPGSSYLGNQQSKLFIDYPTALLNIIQRFRKKYPDVHMMVCSGGGGRMDYATMPYFQEYWPSDNTDALDRIKIQWGLQYFYPAVGLAAHVTPNHSDERITPLKFRFDVAMTGRLGLDYRVDKLNADEKTFAINAIATYKKVRNIVLYGDLYRLLSPYENRRAALMYVSENKDSALVFSFLQKKETYPDKTKLLLKGLDANAQYKLTEINKGSFSRLDDYEGKTFSGAFLMAAGLQFDMYNDYESAVMQLVKQ
ncbi:MAG: alpha-galactosidase [Parafilimonas sp.]